MVSRSNSGRREGALQGGATALCALLLTMTACTPILPDDPDSGSDAGPGEMDGGLDAGTERDAGSADAGRVEHDDGGAQPDGGGPPDAGPRCGDGIVDSEAGEVCDDGNTIGGDGCSADCMSDESCGNGIRDLATDEACDDGNTVDGDGCPADCALEPTAIAAGWTHTCVRLSDGRVFCWGSNESGELGASAATTPHSEVPLAVPGITDAVAIAAGHDHNCAVTAGENVVCWGANGHGQLGRGSIGASHTPVVVAGLTRPIQVVAGRVHTCALEMDGRVMCWGRNDFGQLGNGATLPAADATTPVRVSGLTGVVELGAYFQGTCARMADGGVRCWGYNANGQLGQGTDLSMGPGQPSSTPLTVSGLEDSTVAIAQGSGGHVCVSVGAGLVRCWGFNATGQVGDGMPGEDRSSPVDVAGVVATQLATFGHSCAIFAGPSSGLRCWGRNTWGQLGDGTDLDRSGPVEVAGLADLQAIAVGERHSCALRNNGLAFCWGDNTQGQLGNLGTEEQWTAVAVSVEW